MPGSGFVKASFVKFWPKRGRKGVLLRCSDRSQCLQMLSKHVESNVLSCFCLDIFLWPVIWVMNTVVICVLSYQEWWRYWSLVSSYALQRVIKSSLIPPLVFYVKKRFLGWGGVKAVFCYLLPCVHQIISGLSFLLSWSCCSLVLMQWSSSECCKEDVEQDVETLFLKLKICCWLQ